MREPEVKGYGLRISLRNVFYCLKIAACLNQILRNRLFQMQDVDVSEVKHRDISWIGATGAKNVL